MLKKLFSLAQGKCAAESPDSPMAQELLLTGGLYQMVLKVGSIFGHVILYSYKMA